MYRPSQRVRAKTNFLRFGAVEAHIEDEVYVVWDDTQQAVNIRPEDIKAVAPEDEQKAKEGTMRFLKAIRREP